MMVISLLLYQLDEFMEWVAAPTFLHDPDGLHLLIDFVTSEAAPKTNKISLANDARAPSSASHSDVRAHD